ncbi:MAG: HAD-IC family P-type ATPase [Candidatus Alkaliphilus sp. MAG34]
MRAPNDVDFHLIPGRLRMGVPGLLNNQGLANSVVYRLSQFPGVRTSYANPITGRVLINFDHRRTDLGCLISLVFSANGKAPPGNTVHLQNKNVDRYPMTQPGATTQVSPNVPSMPWHVLDSSKVLELTQSSLKTGLSHYTAKERLKVFGPNELGGESENPFWRIITESLKGFMTKLLLVAGGVSLLVGETTDAIVIGAIVVIQAVVEAAQGYRAEKSLDKLKQLSDPLTTVLRGGEIRKIASRELVPGDILRLSAGDMVPADAKIVAASNLLTNEACLTGESIPVAKDSCIKDDLRTPIADQSNMIFTGTGIIGGQVTAIVVNTGMQTELGRIAQLLGDVKSGRTNLQRQLDSLGKKITQLVAASVGTIAIIHLLRGRSIWEVLRTGISLAVGAVPEGLPAVLTVALSTGVQRMVKRNAIVRNLPAVETLGSTTVICSDKTGTLTKNEMTVKNLYVDNTFFEITGDGYKPEGRISHKGPNGQESSYLLAEETLKAASLCNNAELRLSPKGKWTIIGDPTEGALLTAAAKAGLWWQDLKNEFRRHREVAFDNKRRTMTVVCREPEGGYAVYVKGAPDAVINYCSSVIEDAEEQPLNPEICSRILAVNDDMAGKALRVLAVAHKKLPPSTDLNKVDLDSELVFCGLIGMLDSPREGVREAIQKCYAAGIKVIMITGDHQRTAEAIAAKLGISERGKSITGRELEQISDEEFTKQVGNIVVCSRTTPDQKLRIVRALKSCGQVVAMTGDGVNDAPAVKEANIGIAMGLSGTDVTKEVADITLSNDNFVTIVNGIEEGRTISMNLSKSVRYILSGSVGQLVTVFTSAALGLPTPLLPSQILWVNLVTESLPAMSLLADPPEKDYMRQPPINAEERFLPDKGRTILRKGALFGLNTFSLFASGLALGKWSLNKARTMAFSQVVINRVFNLINEQKTRNTNVFNTGGNPLTLPAVAATVSMLAATMYLPFMGPLFSTVPIGLEDWILLIANAFVTGKIDFFLGAGSRENQNFKAMPLPSTNRRCLPSGQS